MGVGRYFHTSHMKNHMNTCVRLRAGLRPLPLSSLPAPLPLPPPPLPLPPSPSSFPSPAPPAFLSSVSSFCLSLLPPPSSSNPPVTLPASNKTSCSTLSIHHSGSDHSLALSSSPLPPPSLFQSCSHTPSVPASIKTSFSASSV